MSQRVVFGAVLTHSGAAAATGARSVVKPSAPAAKSNAGFTYL
ncbi:hypothetical protein [Mycolicibacterium sp. GF69]|nr:hypothetical protein [Mycolicibacterium sp. GF69]